MTTEEARKLIQDSKEKLLSLKAKIAALEQEIYEWEMFFEQQTKGNL